MFVNHTPTHSNDILWSIARATKTTDKEQKFLFKDIPPKSNQIIFGKIGSDVCKILHSQQVSSGLVTFTSHFSPYLQHHLLLRRPNAKPDCIGLFVNTFPPKNGNTL